MSVEKYTGRSFCLLLSISNRDSSLSLTQLLMREGILAGELIAADSLRQNLMGPSVRTFMPFACMCPLVTPTGGLLCRSDPPPPCWKEQRLAPFAHHPDLIANASLL
jgi:hypothetical protein